MIFQDQPGIPQVLQLRLCDHADHADHAPQPEHYSKNAVRPWQSVFKRLKECCLGEQDETIDVINIRSTHHDDIGLQPETHPAQRQ
jgi:hypothetical protein